MIMRIQEDCAAAAYGVTDHAFNGKFMQEYDEELEHCKASFATQDDMLAYFKLDKEEVEAAGASLAAEKGKEREQGNKRERPENQEEEEEESGPAAKRLRTKTPPPPPSNQLAR